MHLVYSLEEAPRSFSKSIFLAGPTPRSSLVESRRLKELATLKELNYNGVVFIPENRPGSHTAPPVEGGYPGWEQEMMAMSDLILIWAERDMRLSPEFISELQYAHPRDIELLEASLRLPAFTTNVEFGLYANSGKCLFGPPDGAQNSYLKFKSAHYHIPQFDTFEDMAVKTLEMLSNGHWRTGGERNIPLFIWGHRAFQSWYRAQRGAGNRLDGASIEWISRVTSKPQAIFAFALRPNIFVAGENRNKVNDPVVFRLDISSVVLYKKRPNLLDSEVVIIREFRSAASTSDGFVWELPGGSSPFITGPLEVAVEEIKEEVGLNIKPECLSYIGSRQMAATLSEHKSHTYSAELTDEELEWCKSQKDIPHGSDFPHNPTGERAYTEVLTLREIKDKKLVDWSNLGMIDEALGLS